MIELNKYYQRTREFDTILRPAYNNLGNCFAKLDRLDEAIAEYKRARVLGPDMMQAGVLKDNRK